MTTLAEQFRALSVEASRQGVQRAVAKAVARRDERYAAYRRFMAANPYLTDAEVAAHFGVTRRTIGRAKVVRNG